MARKRSGTGPADGQPGAASTPDDAADEASNGSPHAAGDADIDGEAQVAGNAADDTDNGTVVDETDDDAANGSGEYDEYDGDEDDGEDDDAADGATNGRPNSPVWTTGWQRLSKTFVTPPGQSRQRAPRATAAQSSTPDFSAMTDTEKRNLVNQIDPTERKIGYVASTLAIVLTLVANIPYMVRRVGRDDDEAERPQLREPLHVHDAQRRRGHLQHHLLDEPLRLGSGRPPRVLGGDLRHRPHRSPGAAGVHVGPHRPGDRFGHRQHDHRPAVHLRRRLAAAPGVAQPEVRLAVGQGGTTWVHATATRTGPEGRVHQRPVGQQHDERRPALPQGPATGDDGHRPGGADGEQALHAEGAAEEEDPAARLRWTLPHRPSGSASRRVGHQGRAQQVEDVGAATHE